MLLFLITLVVSLLGLRLSGLVDDLGGVDLLAIVGFSLVIAFGGTFGATVGLSALSTVGACLAKEATEPPETVKLLEVHLVRAHSLTAVLT